MKTYEQILRIVEEAARPTLPGKREVHWISDAHVVGLSRTHEDRIEIFLRGPELATLSPSVRESLRFGPWYGNKGTSAAFEASRLLLPPQGHFNQVAAFVSAELLRNGADINVAAAFKSTEPLIALLFERLWLSDNSLLGLIGELMILESLGGMVPDAQVADVVVAWDGWQRSLRDFRVGLVGVEVKTTTRAGSSHQIQGTHQVEPDDGETGGSVESGLILISIGLNRATPHGSTITLPSLVDSICRRLGEVKREDLVAGFLAHVNEYGSVSGFGYDHLTMRDEPAFSGPFEVNFVRGYDMTDSNISVLRRVDVVGHYHIDAGSLSYTLDLPTKVTGDINPIVGLKQVASAVLAAGGFVR